MANWNALMQAPDAGAATVNAFNQSRDRKQNEELQGIRMREHQEDRQFQREGRAIEQRKAQLAEAREKLTMTVQLMDGATAQDWGQRLQAAQGMGLDVSQVPPQFDPQWLQQSSHQARVLLGKIDQELMAVAPGTTVINKRTGQPVYQNQRGPRYIPVQAGGRLVLDPASVGGATPPMVGGDDDEWETIGGPSPGGSGGF
jgi:RNA polymerase-binding transcription factor DksA